MSYWKLWVRTIYYGAPGAAVSTDVIEFTERREADEAYSNLKCAAEVEKITINVVKLYKDF